MRKQGPAPSRRTLLLAGRGVALAGAGDLRLLEAAVRGDGAEVTLVTDPALIGRVLDLILDAKAAQGADPAFASALKSWLRFDARAGIEAGDGFTPPCRAIPRCRRSSTASSRSAPRMTGMPGTCGPRRALR